MVALNRRSRCLDPFPRLSTTLFHSPLYHKIYHSTQNIYRSKHRKHLKQSCSGVTIKFLTSQPPVSPRVSKPYSVGALAVVAKYQQTGNYTKEDSAVLGDTPLPNAQHQKNTFHQVAQCPKTETHKNPSSELKVTMLFVPKH